MTRQKHRVAGPTTGCCPKKAPCIEEKHRVRPPACACVLVLFLYSLYLNTKNTGKYMSSNDRKYFICTEGGKHNRTPTQAHTSRYSRHLRHALESVGLHRRYTLVRKLQVATFRGAGACPHERRIGVVATEGAAAKGHGPRLGLGRQEMLSRCLGLCRQTIFAGHLEVGEPPPDREVLPKQGPGPNVGLMLKDLNRYREHTIVRCESNGQYALEVLQCTTMMSRRKSRHSQSLLQSRRT